MSDSASARRGTLHEDAKPLSPGDREHAERSRPCNFCHDDSISLDPIVGIGSTTQSVTDTTQPQPFARPFDERSALEELEQLADKIQRSRRQREEKVAEFDAFVRAFRQDRYAASIAASERELLRAEARPAAASAATHAASGVAPVAQAGASPATASAAVPASLPESDAVGRGSAPRAGREGRDGSTGPAARSVRRCRPRRPRRGAGHRAVVAVSRGASRPFGFSRGPRGIDSPGRAGRRGTRRDRASTRARGWTAARRQHRAHHHSSGVDTRHCRRPSRHLSFTRR